MNLNKKQVDALLSILEFEQTHDLGEFSLGWSWSDVRVSPATLNNLILKGLVEEKFHSNSYRGLLLTNAGHEQAEQLTEPTEVHEKPLDQTLMVASDILGDIMGLGLAP